MLSRSDKRTSTDEISSFSARSSSRFSEPNTTALASLSERKCDSVARRSSSFFFAAVASVLEVMPFRICKNGPASKVAAVRLAGMSTHHHFDFVELPVTDVAQAKAFYAAAFGWSFVDFGPDYADIQGAGLSGGLRKVDARPTNGGTLAIVYSSDLAHSERAVTAAGAKVTERHEFPGGKRFHFLDPSGNELAVWTKV